MEQKIDIFAIRDIVILILDYLPDVRVAAVCRGLHGIVASHPDTQHWRKYPAYNDDIIRYGAPKMLELINWNPDDALVSAAIHNNTHMVRHVCAVCPGIKRSAVTALGIAASRGYLDVVKCLHEYGVDIRVHTDFALNVASEYGHLETVRYLHSAGAAPDSYNNYALRYAIKGGHLEVVKYLMGAGANLGLINHGSAIDSAVVSGHLHVVKHICEDKPNIAVDYATMLATASKLGWYDIANYACMSVHIWSQNDLNHALINACERGHLAIVQLLHRYGADIRAFEDYPIRGAVMGNSLSVVRYLHDHNADVTAQDNQSIRYAIARQQWKTVECLVSLGAHM